jgi:hypothetical protein
LAFLRFSRDKRGVENFYLVQPTTNRRGKVRPRVLYWFRTPPDVKVGRRPFDPEVRRALEAQNPGIDFDWRGIVETPIPSADADKWRERRRAERAAKHAAAEEDAKQASDDVELADAATGMTNPGSESAESAETPQVDGVAALGSAAVGAPENVVRSADRGDRRRRRRRRNGGRDGNSRPDPTPTSSTTEPSGD